MPKLLDMEAFGKSPLHTTKRTIRGKEVGCADALAPLGGLKAAMDVIRSCATRGTGTQ